MRSEIISDIKLHVKRTGIKLNQILKWYGIKSSTYYSWFDSKKELILKRKPRMKTVLSALPEAIDKLCYYRTLFPDIGYRKLTWMLIDLGAVFLSESTVYRALKANNLLKIANHVNTYASDEYKNKPKYVHHHWHTDLAYIKIGNSFFYLIMVLDGYSRFLLNWSLLTDMSENSVSMFIAETKEMYPHKNPFLIMDNGSQFTSKDFKKLLERININPIHTRRNHPQTNGKIERMNGTVKQEAIRVKYPQSYSEAISILEEYHYEYNYCRVHAGINFLRPADVFFGRDKIIIEERKNKIMLAKLRRMEQNKTEIERLAS